MKKFELAVAGFVILPLMSLSQRTPETETDDYSYQSSRNFTRFSRVMPISNMDQRKIYNWGNGQRSTPAGRQAGRSNVYFAKVFGDSAIVVANSYGSNSSLQRKPRVINRSFKHAQVIPIMSMDQRRIYNWGNGQRSTPTGRQAYERNVKYAKVLGDSAIVVRGPG